MQPDKEIERIKNEYLRRRTDIAPDFYSLDKPGNLFMYNRRTEEVIRTLKEESFFPMKGKKVLEIGCGKGMWLRDFETWGVVQSDIYGMDLDKERIQEAAASLPEADLRTGDVSKLPWPDKSFDLVLQSTVFSSILSPEMKRAVAGEMLRVMKPSGTILWYDFFWNNPWNSNVRGVKSGEIRKLFPETEIKLTRITLAPPLSRKLAGFSKGLCSLFEKFKILNTHYLGVIKKIR